MTVVPISCQSEGALEVYIEPVLPAPHLVIVGRSPMASTLADLARALGWRTTRWTGRTSPPADADERSMVVVATQGHGDEEAVEQAVAARPAYLGLVASAKRGEAVLGYLADRGRARRPARPGPGPGRARPRAHHAPGDRGGDPGRAGPAPRGRGDHWRGRRPVGGRKDSGQRGARGGRRPGLRDDGRGRPGAARSSTTASPTTSAAPAAARRSSSDPAAYLTRESRC